MPEPPAASAPDSESGTGLGRPQPESAESRGYAKGRAKREEILEAAIAVFGESGYHAASLREISSRVGMSHPGLLHHFPTKVALVQAVLDRRDAEDDALIEIVAGVDFFEFLVRVVERNAERRPLVELFVALSAEATSPDHPAHRQIRERYDRMLSQCAQAFAMARDEGRLRPGVQPESAARTLVAVMDGLQVQWLLSLDGTGPVVDMAAEVRAWLQLIRA